MMNTGCSLNLGGFNGAYRLNQPGIGKCRSEGIYEKTLRASLATLQKALAHRRRCLRLSSFYASVGRSLDRKLYELIYPFA